MRDKEIEKIRTVFFTRKRRGSHDRGIYNKHYKEKVDYIRTLSYNIRTRSVQ